ncbi:MAG: hypothetical protein K8H89_06260 [Flavobacteriales bacterium]|jgi:heme-degrading monooxygenase HmoA|nr:hypothetical protein [Flavobacteriales bacterium]MCB0757855.1 hypothetical protein [Flavobacteriales bacterium]
MKKVLVEFQFKGMTTPQFDTIWKDCRNAGYAEPKGLLQHTAAKTPDGMKVVDVWESEDAFNQFGKVLTPIVSKHGFANVKPNVDPVHFEYAAKVKEKATAY